MSLAWFPVLNAALNGLSAILLISAFVMIRRRNVNAHRRLMLSACAVSLLFLVSYVTYHTLRHGVVTRFAGAGFWKLFYLTMLTSHTVFAITVVPLAIVTVVRGLKTRVEAHRRIARWTLPIWIYVSITGVLVYFFLYRWFPQRPL